jgi:hypothetical protein
VQVIRVQDGMRRLTAARCIVASVITVLGFTTLAACATPANNSAGSADGSSAAPTAVTSAGVNSATTVSAGPSAGPIPRPSDPLTPIPTPFPVKVPPPQPVTTDDGTMSISGTIFQGAEPTCKLISVQKVIYLLLAGDSVQITIGDEATVTGHVEHGIMTHCQQGIPFAVTTIHQAAPAK